jgi:orotate phosphoribosyltransferase
VGGIIPGYETARHLGVPSIYVEREDGAFRLRRGFHLEPGARVAMVEDIVTTGLSSRECIQAIREAGGEVVCAACIVDRSGGKADVSAPLVALASLEVPAYPADALPPELAAIPTEDPGSRARPIPTRRAPPNWRWRPARTASPRICGKIAGTSPTPTSTPWRIFAAGGDDR